MFWEAICERTPLEFDYLRSGTDKVTTRHLQPWGVTRYSGRWYAVGFDTDRGAERVFRLSRVQGAARKVGQPGSYEIPADTDIKEVSRRLAPAPTSEPAVILARKGAAWPLRRSADSVEEDVTGPDDKTRWDRLVLSRGGVGLVEEVLGFGADVYVEESARLRDEVVSRLREAVS